MSSKGPLAEKLSGVGNFWLSALLVLLALYLLYTAFFTDSLALKAITAAWVILP